MTLTARMTSQGRVTLPAALRASMGLVAGTRLRFTVLGDGTVVMRALCLRPGDVAGSLTRPGQPSMPVEQLSR